jgi:polyisoprenoid-binding protein YceI
MIKEKHMHNIRVRSLCFLIFVALLAACTAPATPAPTPTPTPAANPAGAAGGLRTFVIAPAESTAKYLADEEFFGGALAKYGIAAGDSDVVGETQAFEGQLQLNLDDLSSPLGDNNFTVQMNTLTTDRELRDSWIREDGPRFNDYPLATFQATAIEGAPGSYTEGEEVSFRLSGDLTIREITKPVTFDVTASLTGDTLTGIATTRLLMSDFGIEPPNFADTLTVADEFGIEVQFTAREQ